MTASDHGVRATHLDPSWRWRAATAACAPGERPLATDEWVVAAYEAARRNDPEPIWDGEFDSQNRVDLVAGAYNIWSNTASSAAAMVESMILGGATDEEIGAYMLLHAGIVEAYERCFFAVRQWLKAPGRIACLLVRDTLSIRADDPLASQAALFALWKRAAYHFGLDAFKALAEMRSLDPPVSKALDAMVRDEAMKRAAMAAITMQVDREHADVPIRLWISLKRLELAEAKQQQKARREKRDAEVRNSVVQAKEMAARKKTELHEAVAERERADAATMRELARETATRVMGFLRSRPLPSEGLRSLKWPGARPRATRLSRTAA